MRGPRVALVHDWLTGMRGGERVLAVLARALPQADILTLVHRRGSVWPELERRRIVTSALNDLGPLRRWYRHFLPLMPLAVEGLNAASYDVVISCSHCVAKGVIVRPDAAHVCVCFTPMRYIWDRTADYAAGMGATGLLLRGVGAYLRAWDRRSAGHVDEFAAISRCVADRIRRHYGRTSTVVHPPIDAAFHTPGDVAREGHYLMVNALAPYKRVDVAIGACALAGRRLVVVGDGPEMQRLRALAGPHVRFEGRLSDEAVREHYRRCAALLMPGEEDFGLAPLEAMACGAPVIALDSGGALDTVIDPSDVQPVGPAPTGLRHALPTAESLARAIERFESMPRAFDPRALRAWAERFSPGRFLDGVMGLVRPYLTGEGWSRLCSNATAN